MKIDKYFCFILVFIIESCNNHDIKINDSKLVNINSNDQLVTKHEFIIGKWEQFKKIEVINDDTVAESNAFVIIDSNFNISKIINNKLVYSSLLSKLNEKKYSFDEGKHNIYLKNDTIMSISYFNLEGKLEVYRRVLYLK